MSSFSDRISHVRKSGIREIFDLAQSMPNYINLGIGEPDFAPPSFAARAAKRAIDQGFSKYTSNVGILELRQAISRKLQKENGIDTDPEKEVIVTAGATQAIFVLMHALLNPGDEVLLPTPVFTAYKYCTLLAGGVPVEIPLESAEGYALNVSSLASKVTNRTKLLVLNSPCNPTGAVFSKKSLEEACQFASEHGLYIVSDEIYEKFLYEGARHFSPASISEFQKRIITINGFSKTYAMTGWRIGYAVASEEIIRVMTLFNMYNAVCATSFVQIAAAKALSHSQAFFSPILKRFDRRRALMCEKLEEMELEFSKPKGAFYVFPSLGKWGSDSIAFCKSLLTKHGVSAVPGSSFGAVGEGHIRLSYAIGERSMRVALDRMQRHLQESAK